VKIAAVPVGPVQHWGDAKFSAGMSVFILSMCQFLSGS
jgi:hypothetical protein